MGLYKKDCNTVNKMLLAQVLQDIMLIRTMRLARLARAVRLLVQFRNPSSLARLPCEMHKEENMFIIICWR
eukprot:4448085-Amphidinium_carterae.2